MADGSEERQRGPDPNLGNIRPNWGVGRNSRIKLFFNADHAVVEAAYNAWAQGLNEEKILEIWITTQEEFGGGGGEANHLWVLYTEN